MAAGTEMIDSRKVRKTVEYTDTICVFKGGTAQAVGDAHPVTAGLGSLIGGGHFFDPIGYPDGTAKEVAVFRVWNTQA